MRAGRAAEVACVAAAANGVFIVALGGARALEEVNAAWLVFFVPAAIGGAL